MIEQERLKKRVRSFEHMDDGEDDEGFDPELHS